MMIHRSWRYIIFKIDPEDHNSVYIDKCGMRDSTYEEFLESIPTDEPRWIIYDFEYEAQSYGVMSTKKKCVFIIYSPDDSRDMKSKSLITFKKDMLLKRITQKTTINRNLMEYKAMCHSDLELDVVKRKLLN